MEKMEAVNYEIEHDDKSPDWIKQRMNEKLNGLDESIFSDKIISPDEAIIVLNHIGNKNWKNEAHAQHVAALQVSLKFLDENVDDLDSNPGKIDAMLAKGKGSGKTKGALKKFQEWYNSQDELNNGNDIDVDGEPGPQSVKALIAAIEHLESNSDVPDYSNSREIDEPKVLTGISSSSDPFSSSEDFNSSASSIGDSLRSEQASSADASDGGSVLPASSSEASLTEEEQATLDAIRKKLK